VHVVGTVRAFILDCLPAIKYKVIDIAIRRQRDRQYIEQKSRKRDGDIHM
jgi:hypothetical protein